MSHPIHPALVHFPIACWSLATLGDLAGLAEFQHKDQLLMFTAVMLMIGLISAVAAMLAGIVELKNVDPQGSGPTVVGWHIHCVGLAWVLYLISLLLRIENGNVLQPGLLALILSIAGFVFLCLGAWFGGRLVYQYGAGVNSSLRK